MWSSEKGRFAGCWFGTTVLFRRSAIPKVLCADTRHSVNIWVKVKVMVRVSLRVRFMVSGNSRLSE